MTNYSLKKHSLILLVASFLFFCFSSVQAKPGWISGSSDDFPSKKYLVGVGDSPSQSRAKDKARADLVKTIKVKIDASSSLREKVNAYNNDGDISEDVQRVSVDDIQITSEIEIKNIRIEDTWYDEENDVYFALAVLSRSKASFDLTFEMDELDRQTSRYLKQKNNVISPFEKIALINKAILSQKEHGVLQGYLLAIDSIPARLIPKHDLDLLYKQLAVIQKHISVDIHVNEPSLKLYAENRLSSYGYDVVRDGSGDFIFNIRLENEPVFFKDDLYWAYSNLEFKMVDKEKNKVLGVCNRNIKEASQFKKHTKRKVLLEVKRVFNDELEAILDSFSSREACSNSKN